MDATGDGRLGNVRAAFWWIAWHPLVSAIVGGFGGIAVGNVLALGVYRVLGVPVFSTDLAFGAAGILVGVLAWYRGTAVVNEHADRVLDSFRTGATPTDGPLTTYALLEGGSGSTPLVRPAASYDATFLVADRDRVAAYDGTLAMDDRRREYGEPRVSIPYDDVRVVSAEPSSLDVETWDGDRFGFHADVRPTAAARGLRDRIERAPPASAGDGDQPDPED